MEDSRNQQFINFEVLAILSDMMKSRAILLHLPRKCIIPLVSNIHSVYVLSLYPH